MNGGNSFDHRGELVQEESPRPKITEGAKIVFQPVARTAASALALVCWYWLGLFSDAERAHVQAARRRQHPAGGRWAFCVERDMRAPETPFSTPTRLITASMPEASRTSASAS